MEEQKKKKKNILLIALKRHKISLAFVLFFAFASVSFAWFIYNKTVDVTVQGHVKSWNLELGDGSGDTFVFQLSDLYPGMPDAADAVAISNNGEMNATLSLEFNSLKLFGEEQQIKDATHTVKKDADHPNGYDFEVQYTAATGVYKIIGYPFDLSFKLGATQLNAGSAITSGLSFDLKWDYDNSEAACTVNNVNICDQEDTELGEKSYLYHSGDGTDAHPAHPSSEYPSLEIVIKLDMVETRP